MGFLNYRPASLKASDKCAKSEIDKASPRIEGFISAISKAFSSLDFTSSDISDRLIEKKHEEDDLNDLIGGLED